VLSTMSSTTAAEDKAALRRQVRLTLDGLSPDALRRSDDALFAAFSALPQVEAASTIFAFWGIPGREPETGRLVQALTARGKRAFGILEPPADAPLLPRADIGLALVPAVCYDRRGFRLGFGGGYYDRWLSGFSGVTVGLCRDCVLQEHVPIEDHDRRVEFLLTESRRFSL